MLWTEKAKEIFNNTEQWIDFNKFICLRKKEKEFFKRFNVTKNDPFPTEFPLMNWFLAGAVMNDDEVIHDMELLFHLFKQWKGDNDE